MALAAACLLYPPPRAGGGWRRPGGGLRSEGPSPARGMSLDRTFDLGPGATPASLGETPSLPQHWGRDRLRAGEETNFSRSFGAQPGLGAWPPVQPPTPPRAARPFAPCRADPGRAGLPLPQSWGRGRAVAKRMDADCCRSCDGAQTPVQTFCPTTCRARGEGGRGNRGREGVSTAGPLRSPEYARG